jgi:hypothetical protein
VIVKVNDESVHDTSDFSHAMKSRDSNSVGVSVIRDKKEQNLNLALPDRKDHSWFEEESFGAQPLTDAQNLCQMSELQNKIASVQPQVDLQKELERAQANAAKAQKQAMEQAEKEQKKFKGEREKLKNELDRMVKQMQRDWL